MASGGYGLHLEEICQSVRNNLQLIIESQGLPLAVGPLTDDDCRILSGGFGELGWDYALTKYGNDPNKFEFCIKLVKQVAETVPSGVALCVYGIDDHVFRIHMIERFCRDDESHPLKGRMVALAIMAAFIFCKAVDAVDVFIMEPVAELVDYYHSFGFVEHESASYVLRASVDDLVSAFEVFAQK
ncbi:hypothetical protein ACOGYE_000005 [Edwardsiella piscicida]|uniref:hypothetical protein n=1 Tax=Edwardsiella piscicida TaxID=1263550 RepID=UPI000D517710|nr:hypothetical protein [Edwardsiella piscicida]EKS7794427.1 hypothetical protein [Edwardsiella piscicida]ELM3729356.1 hypothetical protein [Edwardsiella piscicida]ELV7536566.1 hypothetical protein [Edwardsiella piscicida]UCQ45942.1 hypothetical protein DCF39_07820 [Edwardsiella piscicida]